MKLETFLTENRAEIIDRCQKRVQERKATDAELEGVPLFLDHLVAILARDPSQASEATQHGRDLLEAGFTIAQVVHDYGDVCQTVTGLAIELEAPISNEDFRTLNFALDNAIADAVTEFTRVTEAAADDVHARARDVRTMLASAITTFGLLRVGSVGFSGATGGALERLLGRVQADVEEIFALTLSTPAPTEISATGS
jgi:hypothetical protein